MTLKLLSAKWNPPADPTTSFAGKTVLLTGGTSGLGFEAAIKFVSLGVDTLIIGARNLTTANQAREEIETRSKRHGVVQIWELDMNSFASVEAFADRVDRELVKLDVALLNAGLYMRKYVKSPDGWEETLQVNILSTTLLALLLLPKLKASGTDADPVHLAITSSGLHGYVQPDWVNVEGSILEHLNDEASFSRDRQYNTTKLLVEYTVKSLAALVTGSDGKTSIIVTSLCPGFCTSGLARQFDSLPERVFKFIFWGIFARPTEQGSRSLVSATTQGLESHGRFWKDDKYDS
jgi:NAD(P)-dependent dehydrogenase (short-subunit alcohol dehydrogenase family)